MTEIAYKFLGPGRAPCNGGRGAWPEPGLWTPRVGHVVPCESGWHGCRPHQLLDWIGPELWRAEFEDVVEAGDKIVAARARLIERVAAWDERSARLFACDCAERVVRLTGPDERCVAAIAAARRFATGEATAAELAAAGAAGAAGSAAAVAALWATARDATGAAYRAASWAAGAAWNAAGNAAWNAERTWQTARLLDRLGLSEAA